MDSKSRKELQDVARVLNIYAGGTQEEIEERLEDEFLSDISSRTKKELQNVARILNIYAGGSKEELEERILEELADDGAPPLAEFENFCDVVSTWTKPLLQQFLRDCSLPISGNKDVLFERIVDGYPYDLPGPIQYYFQEETDEDDDDDDEDESDDEYADSIASLGASLHGMNLRKNRKALIVACSYRKSDISELSGTLRDADKIQDLLTDVFDFGGGHGSQEEDKKGTERSGYNQTICPIDATCEGSIKDSYLNDKLVKPLPAGASLHALIDSCHSGTIMNLPFNAVTVKGNFQKWENEYSQDKLHKVSSAGGTVFQFSAAAAHELAGEFQTPQSGNGAATYAFCSAIKSHREQWGSNKMTYGGLLKAMYDELREDRHYHDQTPTLSSCNPIDCKSTTVTFKL